MYCQKICGEADFSIEEYNKAYQEAKTLTVEQKKIFMQPVEKCVGQCAECKAIVNKRRNETDELVKKLHVHDKSK